MTVRALLFDLFDTLVDLPYENLETVQYEGRTIPATARALHAAVAERANVDFATFLRAATEVDAEFRRSHYARDLELPTEERFTAVVDRLGVDAPSLPAVLTAIHMGTIRDLVKVPAHHPAILAGLRRRVRTGLCSNFSHSETARRILAEADLLPHLDAIVISDAVGIRKPREEIFGATLAELGVAPEEALHVGDSLHADVDGAAACGIRSVWITRRISDPEAQLRDHRGAEPDFVIRDLSELSRLLDSSEPGRSGES